MMQTSKISLPSKGYYTLSKVDAYGNPRATGCAGSTVHNVITYEGAFHCLLDKGIFSKHYAAIGTGSAERTRASTALGEEDSGRTEGWSHSRSNEVDNLDGTSTFTLTRNLAFGLGAKVGTFSEVGLYSKSKGGVLIAGQLIKDELGTPTTVTVLADEQLIVTYTLEWTVPNKPSMIGTGTVNDYAGNSYEYEIWAQPYFADYEVGKSEKRSRFTDERSPMRPLNATGSEVLAGREYGSQSREHSEGVVTIKTGTVTWGPTDFTGDIGYLSVGGSYNYGFGSTEVLSSEDPVLGKPGSSKLSGPPLFIKFTPAIPKTSDDTFALNIEYSLEI